MEVRLNTNIDPVSSKPVDPTQARQSPAESDTARFDQAAGLDQSLEATPPVRADAVERGRELAQDSHYPPMETMRRIATLLAIHLNQDQP